MHSKIETRVQRFPIYVPPQHMHGSSIINILSHSGVFDTADKPTSVHHNEISSGGDADTLEFSSGDECTVL